MFRLQPIYLLRASEGTSPTAPASLQLKKPADTPGVWVTLGRPGFRV